MADYFMTGSFRDKGSWHGKEMQNTAGGIFTGQTTIMEQMEKSNMLYTVHKCPAEFVLPDGTRMQDGGRFGLIREATVWDTEPRRLRVVGNRYEPLQNIQLGAIFEPLQKDWPLESIMVLKQGAITAFELKMDPFDVGGMEQEAHESYFLVSNDHTMNSIYMGETFVRVVCWNTYSLALGGDAKTFAKIPHSTDVQLEMAFRAAVMERAIERRKEEQHVLNSMFRTPVDKAGLANIIEAAYPMPQKGRRARLVESIGADMPEGDIVDAFMNEATSEQGLFEVAVERVKRQREEVASNFGKFNDEHDYAANTLYAAFQAVTETVNHSSLYTGSAEKGVVSLLAGQKRKSNEDAYKAAVALL